MDMGILRSHKQSQRTDTSLIPVETGHRGHVNPGARLLCLIGIHRYDWRSKVYTDDSHAGHEVSVDQYRCKNPLCTQGRFWITANVETRKPW